MQDSWTPTFFCMYVHSLINSSEAKEGKGEPNRHLNGDSFVHPPQFCDTCEDKAVILLDSV